MGFWDFIIFFNNILHFNPLNITLQSFCGIIIRIGEIINIPPSVSAHIHKGELQVTKFGQKYLKEVGGFH